MTPALSLEGRVSPVQLKIVIVGSVWGTLLRFGAGNEPLGPLILKKVSGKWELLWGWSQLLSLWDVLGEEEATLTCWGFSPVQVVLGGGQEAMDVTTTSTRIGKFEARLVPLLLTGLNPHREGSSQPGAAVLRASHSWSC